MALTTGRNFCPSGTRVLSAKKVVTDVSAAGAFWEAEPEHQDYLQRYPDGYTCHFPRPNWKLPSRHATS